MSFIANFLFAESAVFMHHHKLTHFFSLHNKVFNREMLVFIFLFSIELSVAYVPDYQNYELNKQFDSDIQVLGFSGWFLLLLICIQSFIAHY